MNGKSKFAPLYLFVSAILAVAALPKALMAVMMVVTGKALSSALSGFCTVCGTIAGCVLFYLALAVGKNLLKAVKDVLFGWLCLTVTRQFFFLIHNFGPLSGAGRLSAAALAVDIVFLVIEALFFAYLLFVWILMIRDENGAPGIKRRFSLAFKGFREILLCGAIYGAVSFGGGFLSDMLVTGLGKSRSVAAFLVKVVLLALLAAAALCPAVYLMQKRADKLTAGAEAPAADGPAKAEAAAETEATETEAAEPSSPAPQSAPSEPFSRRVKALFPLPEAIVFGAAALAAITLSLIPLFLTPARSGAVLASLDAGMADSFAYAEKRDYLMALKSVDRAEALPAAWRAYLEGDPEAAGEAYARGGDLSMVELLYFYTCAENKVSDEKAAPDLTFALKAHEGDEVWYFGYLDILSKKGALTDAERQEKRRILMELAAGDRFNCAAVLPSELTKAERNAILENV
ncbi:MAG: hypothetical protein II776_02015, partial [Clostridia bacterium]|nr:hypothetical protein [Clostridia bacterium]